MKILKVVLASLVISTVLTACSSNESDVLDTPNIGEAQNLTTPDIDEQVDEDYHFGRFTSTTLSGVEVSDDIFSDYDLTMVNIWATWCSPCVKEMPDLAQLYTMLPDSMNMFTICSDASTSEELALTILEDCSAEFDTVIANDEVNSNILSRISAFPTSIFVDSSGEVMYFIEGAPNSDDIAGVYLELMEDILAFINGEVEVDV